MSKRKENMKNPKEVTKSLNYFIKDPRTAIKCLSSKDYEVALKTISTISVYARDERFIENLFNNGLYPILIQLLTHADDCILKFTLRILSQLLSREKYAKKLTFKENFSSMAIVTKLFLENEDESLMENILQVLIYLTQSNCQILSTVISQHFISRIFEVLTKTNSYTIHKPILKLLEIVLKMEMKDDLHKIKGFSVRPLLNLLIYEVDDITESTLKLIQKLAQLNNEDMLLHLSNENTAGVMMKIIMNNTKHKIVAHDIIKILLANKKCALRFSTTSEFIQFCNWFKTCPRTLIESALSVLLLLVQFREVREKLFHLPIEEIMGRIFQYTSEPLIYTLCEMISNLINRKDSAEKFIQPSLIKTLLRMLSDDKIALIPYREIILKTIHDCITQRTCGMFKYLQDYKGFLTIRVLFCNYKDEMSTEGYEMLLNIINLATETQYSQHVTKTEIYDMLLLLCKNKEHMSSALNIIITQIPSKNFRKYFLKSYGPVIMTTGLTSNNNIEIFKQILIVINCMIVYKNVALNYLNIGVLSVLNNFNKKLKRDVPMIDDICNKLYNLCLSLKFFDKGRLEINDILIEKFCLIHHKIKTIYVVEYNNMKKNNIYLHSPALKKIYHSLHNIKSFEASELNVTLQHAISSGVVVQNCISPLNVPQDTHLAQYIKDLQVALFFNEDAIICFKSKVKYIALYVNKQLSSFSGATSSLIQESFYEKHLHELKKKFNSNLIPIGFVKIGFTCEKALLFKVLADNLHIPATLCRGQTGIYWNEVATLPTELNQSSPPTQLKYYVVDLMENIGNLMDVGSNDAAKYCKKITEN